jgi:hypothetical protein
MHRDVRFVGNGGRTPAVNRKKWSSPASYFSLLISPLSVTRRPLPLGARKRSSAFDHPWLHNELEAWNYDPLSVRRSA